MGEWNYQRKQGLKADCSGTAVIEFAVLALPFIALLVVIVVSGRIAVIQASLDSVTDEARRVILVGDAPADAASFRSEVCKMLPSYMSCNALAVSVATAASLSTASTTVPSVTTDSSGNPTGSLSYEPGDTGEVVVLQILYFLPVINGIFGYSPATSSGGRRLLVSTSVIKVEPRHTNAA